MAKDPFHLTKADVQNKDLISFIDRCAEIRRANEESAFSGAYNPSNGVLND